MFFWILLFASASIMVVWAADLEKLPVYRSQGRRDPFVPLVALSMKASAGGLAGVESLEDLQIEGVVLDTNPSLSVVIANGTVLKTGEEVGSVKLVSIRPDGAVFSVNGVEEFKPLYQDENKNKAL